MKDSELSWACSPERRHEKYKVLVGKPEGKKPQEA
jgi:hypothetical protein